MHAYEYTLIAGFLMLIIEMAVLGFGTIVLLFLGLAAVITGVLAFCELLPDDLIVLSITTVVGGALLTASSWSFMKKLQTKQKIRSNTQSDFVGLEFTLTKPLSDHERASVTYSGVAWELSLDGESTQQRLEPGDKIVVVAVDAGRFWVRPLTKPNMG